MDNGLFKYLTPLIYCLLVLIWLYIFFFYIRQLSKKTAFDKLLNVLIFVLAIDALRTLLESLFFGTWYTSLAGLIPIEIYDFLAQPKIVFFPKIINLAASVIILFILIRKWLPSESARISQQKTLIEEQTHKLKDTIKNLEKAKDDLLEQKKVFELMFNTIPDGVVITNTKREIILANNGMKTTFDYLPEEIIGESTKILYATESNFEETGTTVFAENTKEAANLYITNYQKKGGQVFHGETFGTKLYNKEGEWKGNLGIMRDVSERLNAISKLQLAKEKAEESDRLKSAFLANMSHEIRTPMNGILGFTDLLQDDSLSVENQKDYIGIIRKSGDRLLNTVNDIIEISKIESGDIKVKQSKVNIIGHLNTQVTFFKPEAERKNLEIVVENNINGNELIIKTDKNKLSSILSNLIKNAIKYTDEGTIKVGLKIENKQILFTCQDTGIGIPESRQEAIFNRFEQADIEDKQVHEGSGLGLAIVKSYVEMVNGEIWVESEVGLGSIFYVSLPYEHEKKKKHIIPQEVKSSDSGIKNMNVLIVEDEEYSSMHLSILIKDKVKNISIAKNGIEAIDACKNDSGIDLILMDMKMPVMDGVTATKKIREFNKDIVIIAQTAYALEGDKEKALDAGCNNYISKPINKKKLLELINKYF